MCIKELELGKLLCNSSLGFAFLAGVVGGILLPINLALLTFIAWELIYDVR